MVTDEDTKPLVSLGMPVYNGERFIRQALDSLLRQTYTNLEFIISDNASTDRTAEICQEYAARDQRIRYYRNAANIGMTANLRRVFELSSGDYFMWACMDDTRPPTIVASCLEALLKNKRAVMAHGRVLLNLEGREQPVEVTNEMDVSDRKAGVRVREFTNGITSNCIIYGLYRRDALISGTLPNSYGQDYLLCLQMCLLGPLEYVRAPMILYHVRRTVFSDNPMYTEIPVTLMNLLKPGPLPRRKCWTVLFLGCFYLIKMRRKGFGDRLSAIASHILTFCLRYRTRLAKEVAFLVFWPAARLALLLWRLAGRWSLSLRVAHNLRHFLSQV